MFQSYPSKTPRVCLSFGIEKEILNQLSEEVTSEQFEQIVLSSYAIIYPENVVKATSTNLLDRVVTRINEIQKPAETTPTKKAKSFGTSFADWLGSLTATESCLYLADYDIEKALKYYWEEDYLLVQEAIRVKSSKDSQQSLLALEASMYGFGGKYADDSAGEKGTINLDEVNPDDMKAALAGFGF